MSLILSIETATGKCSVCLSRDGLILALKEISENNKHAELVSQYVAELLAECNLAPSSIDAVAVSKGPGSYTGLRIGVSSAKGFCFALNKPLIAVNTLEAMALGARDSWSNESSSAGLPLYFCPMLDARRMEIYTAVYSADMNVVTQTNALILEPTSFQELLSRGKMVFFGDGAEKFKVFAETNENAIFSSSDFVSSKNIASIASSLFREKKFEDLSTFEPYYLKDFLDKPKLK